MGSDRFPPFITSESPSYERASEAFRHPAFESSAELTAAFNFLCEVEQNATAAYQRAAKRVGNEALAARLSSQARAHEERRAALAAEVVRLGGSPPRDEECRALLLNGALEIEDLPNDASDDAVEEILQAMGEELEGLYEKVRARPGLTGSQRDALHRSV
jgi:hypothetical protein